MDVKIVTYGSKEYEQMVVLRDLVLRKPLGLQFSASDLLQEKNQIHIAGFIENAVVATILLEAKGAQMKMRQVAVHPDRQKTGLGSIISAFAESYVKENGFEGIYCHARLEAVPFYQKLGYNIVGDEFEEVGIRHYEMEKKL